MAANAFVRARIDEALKNEAADVLAGMGLTVSDLVRITLTKVAVEKALPFDMRIPNRTTAATIAASEKGVDVHRADDAGVLRRNRRNFRYPSFKPATNVSRSISSLLFWKV
ncbi:TPA: type II toxin-antitoxin system RelB/DinJ family antitoxin [Escherichia coli]